MLTINQAEEHLVKKMRAANAARQILNAENELREAESQLEKSRSYESNTRKMNGVLDEIDLITQRNLTSDILTYRNQILQEALELMATAYIEKLKTKNALAKIRQLLEEKTLTQYHLGALELTADDKEAIESNMLPIIIRDKAKVEFKEILDSLELQFNPQFSDDSMMNGAINDLWKVLKAMV